MVRFLVCMIFCGCQLALAMDLPNSQECSACHFPSRTQVEKKFPTGFGPRCPERKLEVEVKPPEQKPNGTASSDAGNCESDSKLTGGEHR
jgi:hypothetical protein